MGSGSKRLFLVANKEAMVAEVWDASTVRGMEPLFCQAFKDWELEVLERFSLFLRGRGWF